MVWAHPAEAEASDVQRPGRAESVGCEAECKALVAGRPYFNVTPV
jgi:hypothetical protein